MILVPLYLQVIYYSVIFIYIQLKWYIWITHQIQTKEKAKTHRMCQSL